MNASSNLTDLKLYNFSRKFRLTDGKDFRQAFIASTFRIRRPGIILLAVQQPDLVGPRLGIALSKRVLPKSVDRNRVRRLIRDSFRLEKLALPTYDCVIQVKRWPHDLSNTDFKKELAVVWAELRRLSQKRLSQSSRSIDG